MPILINEDLCVKGCTLCDQFCPGDIIYRLDPQKPPVIKYEDECWYCGSCEEYCPTNAVKIVFPREMLHSQIQAESLFGKPVENTNSADEAPTKLSRDGKPVPCSKTEFGKTRGAGAP